MLRFRYFVMFFGLKIAFERLKMKISMMMIGATLADYPGYTIPTEPDVIIWKEPEQDRLFQEKEGHKVHVQFQMPDDEYVPLSDLPIVCK